MTDTVSLHTNSAETIGFHKGEETAVKEVALNISEDNVKIQLNAVDIDTEIDVYPGKWRYRISFAYITNGTDTSDMEFSACNALRELLLLAY